MTPSHFKEISRQETDLDRRNLLAAGTLAAGTLAAGALLAATAGNAQAQQPLPPKFSTRALNTYTGKQAAGIRIDLYQIEGDRRALLKSVQANEEGR